MPEVYEQNLWIPQNFPLTYPDLHHRLLSNLPMRQLLFLLRRLKQQVLIEEADICQRRSGGHACALNAAVRLQGESDKGVFDGVIAPVRLESVVLPVLQVAGHGWRVVEADDESVIFLADGDGTIPSVVVSTGIFLQRQVRLGIRRSRSLCA